MADPAAILASYVRLSTLTDGTVRVVIDVEPKDRAAAFALFDAPGAPVAVARISDQAAVAHDRRQQAQAPESDPLPPRKPPAPLSSLVAMTCAELSFAPFLRAFDPDGFGPVERSDSKEPVAQYVRDWCGVTSRADIRPGTEAAVRWSTLQADYEHFQRSGEVI